MRKVGVLAIQGDYAAHRAALESAGAEVFEVRTIVDLEAVEGLVLPGGESTTIGGLLVRFGLMGPLVDRIRGGMPTFGTCAGLILLAKRVEGREQPGIRLLDAAVRRNAYGRQVDSFRATVRSSIPGAESIEAVFIRAPRILDTGPGVETLARLEEEPVLIRQGNILGCCFHPELVDGAAIHRYFLTF
ncbi:MAG: pyridoxal 5'-phosphate synthase glutaminase subunit PdxT [Spirochaetaceae bacterium]|nr:pyridoxal 5'-phosphate synthase glutaminase subunit PdxT [Spirochaetaceae bacterium]